MKKLFSHGTVLTAIGAALLMAAPAGAQTPILKFDIPFAFTVDNRVVPAGQYRIAVDMDRMWFRIDSTTDTGFWIVRLMPGGTSRPESSVDKGALRFTKYGTQYYLTNIWKVGSTEALGVPRSRGMVERAKVEEVREIGGASELR